MNWRPPIWVSHTCWASAFRNHRRCLGVLYQNSLWQTSFPAFSWIFTGLNDIKRSRQKRQQHPHLRYCTSLTDRTVTTYRPLIALCYNWISDNIKLLRTTTPGSSLHYDCVKKKRMMRIFSAFGRTARECSQQVPTGRGQVVQLIGLGPPRPDS